MDLYKTIRLLHEERERIEKLIESLEELKATGKSAAPRPPRGRRGRKGMSADERQKVSARMRQYWAARRSASGQNNSDVSGASAGAN